MSATHEGERPGSRYSSISTVFQWTIAVVLIALHAAGALKHRLIDRDATLARILPGLRARGA